MQIADQFFLTHSNHKIFKNLINPEVWAGTTIHMLISIIFLGGILWAASSSGLYLLADLNWKTAILIASALSFSSTVLAIKVLEGKKEMSSQHASTAIGILIMQDVIAVIFLAASTGKIPSLWAAPLIVSLFFIKPVLAGFMRQCGHGELLMLFGILMTVAGYNSFEIVG